MIGKKEILFKSKSHTTTQKLNPHMNFKSFLNNHDIKTLDDFFLFLLKESLRKDIRIMERELKLMNRLLYEIEKAEEENRIKIKKM